MFVGADAGWKVSFIQSLKSYLVVVSMVALSLLARILGECSTVHSLLALFKIFV